ncbi:MAG: capsular polysaccharide biosynthesis protein [Pseudoalteromonas tetraodonis]|jgi:capsular polysaccharide biosynthesis protein
MEDQTFKLESALADWRKARDSEGVPAETIEELESHLLESAESLQTSGLSQREAFFTAADRLGNTQDLASPPPPQAIEPPKVVKRSGCMIALGITLLAAGIGICLVSLALALWYFSAPNYASRTVIQVYRSAQAANGKKTISYQTFTQTQFAIIESRKNLTKVMSETGLTKRWDLTTESAYQRLLKNTCTDSIRGTDLIQIQVTNPDRELAALLANSIAKNYVELIASTGNRKPQIHEVAMPGNKPTKMIIPIAIPIAAFVFGLLSIITGIATWRRRS